MGHEFACCGCREPTSVEVANHSSKEIFAAAVLDGRSDDRIRVEISTKLKDHPSPDVAEAIEPDVRRLLIIRVA